MTEVIDWYTDGMAGVCWTQNQWQHGLTVVKQGSGPDSLAQWLEHRTVARDQKVVSSNPCCSGGIKKFSPGGSTFGADSYFGIRATAVLPQ